jgi:hypothetical protein
VNAAAAFVVVTAAGLVLLGVGAALIYSGVYGLTLFATIPVLVGALTTLILQPQTGREAGHKSMLAIVILSGALLLVKIEGLICIAMALPLALPLSMLGGALTFRAMQRGSAKNNMAAMMVLPIATMVFDVSAKPPVFEVTTRVEVSALPEEVWKYVVAFPELAAPTEWYFRSGIAYPIRARIVGSGPGAVRYCDFSTGPFVEPIQVWDEPRLLKFSVTDNPAPMTELSPYADLVPTHLHGYFESSEGQFRLTRLPGNKTLLEGTSWYRHSLWPAQYWRWWSDAIIHRIHLRVLHHIRTLAE